MKQPELVAALHAASARERDARDRLIQARDELNDRVERFAALEEELWSRFEEHELRSREEDDHLRQEADSLREEADRLREEAVRLRVRLDGIQASAPMRLYARVKHLPGLRRVTERRTRRYEAALQARLRQ